MPSFTCQTCGAAFEVPAKSLAKYPGWTPRACRAHRKDSKHKATSGSAGAAAPAARPRAARSAPASAPRGPLPAAVAHHGHSPETGVFTDGSASPNPGPGGWGVVWVQDGRVLAEHAGHEPHTTNNRMELTALIVAYELLPADSTATVYSDSRLCVDTLTKWAAAWEKRGWKKRDGEIKNLELVQRLWALKKARPGVRLEWIAAHVGHRWNERADALATSWMRGSR